MNQNISGGVLHKDFVGRYLQTERSRPADWLAEAVSHYWILHWDVPLGSCLRVRTLGRLGCSLVWAPAPPLVYGVQTQPFSYDLSGTGRIIGVKFTAAGLRAWTGCSARRFTDAAVDAASLFTLPPGFTTRLCTATEGEVPQLLDSLLCNRPQRVDASIRRANAIAAALQAHQDVHRVTELADRIGVGVRFVQKLMHEYAGVTPKWTMDRLRVLRVIRALETDSQADLAQLAIDLGYYDQAHLTAAFSAATGLSPRRYVRTQYELLRE